MSEPTDLFRDYLEKAIIRADEANRDTTSMGADTMQTCLRNQGEDEASRYANELIGMIFRHGNPAQNQPSSSMDRWHYTGTRDDLLGAYIELTLARTAEATRLAVELEADDLRKRVREYDEHEDLEYEEHLITKITQYAEPPAQG